MTAIEMLNANLKAKEKGLPLLFSKKEHSEAKLINAFEKRRWNYFLAEAEQYSKKEHSESEGINVFEKNFWNEDLPEAEQYTDEEINESK